MGKQVHIQNWQQSQIPDLGLEENLLTHENVSRFQPGIRGKGEFLADEDVTLSIPQKLAEAAKTQGKKIPHIAFCAQEMLKNAAQHGLGYSHDKRVVFSWDFGEKPLFEVSNSGSPLFDPAKYSDHDPTTINPLHSDVTIGGKKQTDTNAHVGIRGLLLLAQRLECDWNYENGEKVVFKAQKSGDEKTSKEFHLMRQGGSKTSLDPDNLPDMGPCERFTARLFFKNP